MLKDIRDYLNKYWIEFDLSNHPAGYSSEYGITAFDYADALEILRERVFIEHSLPKIICVIENVDITEFPPAHIGRTERRGIWFPK